MAIILEIASWGLLIVGSVMLIIGGIGINRLPDVFSRMHAAGLIDTMGACSILIGLMLQAGLTIISIKLVLIVVFLLFTSPTTTHALARAAVNAGVLPRLDSANEQNNEIKTDGESSSKT